MKKRMTALAPLLAIGLTQPVAAADVLEGEVFRSQGQCQAALRHAQNDRKTRSGGPIDFYAENPNWTTQRDYECVQIDRRAWMVMRSGN